MPGKQKKNRVLTRKEKKAQVASLIQTANVAKDIMSEMKDLTTYSDGGLDLKIEYHSSDTLNQEERDQVFDLLKQNMQMMYEKSPWGWDEEFKKEELNDEKAKFLLAKNADGKIVAFTHFRFEVEVNYPVLYCYELQVAEEIQRKGLGRYIMNILLLIAFKFKLAKVLLTVFTHNPPALDFYMKSLGFRKDETCPYEEQGKCYVILSQCVDKSLISDIQSKLRIN